MGDVISQIRSQIRYNDYLHLLNTFQHAIYENLKTRMYHQSTHTIMYITHDTSYENILEKHLEKHENKKMDIMYEHDPNHYSYPFEMCLQCLLNHDLRNISFRIPLDDKTVVYCIQALTFHSKDSVVHMHVHYEYPNKIYDAFISNPNTTTTSTTITTDVFT